MTEELQPKQIYKIVKKNPHGYNISTEPFSIANHQFVVHNISLKKDYSNDFQYVNCRRGLTYIEQIIDFKEQNFSVARKGLRKFKDLMPEYLQIKQSHINQSKYHTIERDRLLSKLQNSHALRYQIYNTDKLNGQNAQISYLFENIWVFGSKNKTLLLQKDVPFPQLHQHKLTLLIAKEWFNLISTLSPQLLQQLQDELTNHTLIGQYCNSQVQQHLIDYGSKPCLFFYAIVSKYNLLDECLAPSFTISFCKRYSLPMAKYEIIGSPYVQTTLEQLKKLILKINQQSMEEKGQGSVVYVTSVDGEVETPLLICKIKTIQYRILRKLREKLKIYLEKFNKGYQKLHKQFIEEIVQIAREFQLQKPIQYYSDLALKAFQFCTDQNRHLSRLISNKYITFLKIIKRKDISREQFLQFLHKGAVQEALQKEYSQVVVDSKEKQIIKQNALTKNVLIFVCLTIPSSGKSSSFQKIKQLLPNFTIEIVSSDNARRQAMNEKMRRSRNISQKQAYQKTRKQGNDLYYKYFSEALQKISHSKDQFGFIFLDKNVPQNAINSLLKQLKPRILKYPHLKIKIVGIIPQCKSLLQQKSKFRFPFSVQYILSCLKRISKRNQHQTLVGSIQHKFQVVLGFVNLFRSFTFNTHTLSKYFEYKIQLRFHNDNQQISNKLKQLLLSILLSCKPGDFQIEHPDFPLLIQQIEKLELKQCDSNQCAHHAATVISQLMQQFDTLHFK